MKVVYHGTTKKAAERIMRQGLDSHSWVTTSKKRALEFGKIKAFEGEIPIVLEFKISDEQFNLRAMVISHSPEEDVFRLTNYVYGKGYHKRLLPSNQIDTTSIYFPRRNEK